ncbi:MAG TPA: hypothetical protein VFO85_01760, partial [Vicinamibacteria bacterium]|nr:hypothetical protein [Vicinamibacteria bacterium]
MVMVVVMGLVHRLPAWLGQAASLPLFSDVNAFLGARATLSALLTNQVNATATGLAALLLLTLLRQLTGRTWLALLLVLFLLALPDGLMGTAPAIIAMPGIAAVDGIAGFVLVRYGLLACVVTIYVVQTLMRFPVTMDLASWTGAPAVWAIAVLVGLAVYGFRTALAGRAASGPGALAD